MPRSRTVDLRWHTIFHDFRRSGLTQAEFCRRRQISLCSFRYHFYQPCTSKRTSSGDRSPSGTKLTSSDDRSPSSTDHHFLPVTILPDPTASIPAAQSHLELIIPNGRRIAIAPGFDSQTLRRLIAVVEEHPCLD
jgi:hypothetical protein